MIENQQEIEKIVNVNSFIKRNINYSCFVDLLALGLALSISYNSKGNYETAKMVKEDIIEDIKKITRDILLVAPREFLIKIDKEKACENNCVLFEDKICRDVIIDFDKFLKSNLNDVDFVSLLIYSISITLASMCKIEEYDKQEEKLEELFTKVKKTVERVLIISISDDNYLGFLN